MLKLIQQLFLVPVSPGSGDMRISYEKVMGFLRVVLGSSVTTLAGLGIVELQDPESTVSEIVGNLEIVVDLVLKTIGLLGMAFGVQGLESIRARERVARDAK